MEREIKSLLDRIKRIPAIYAEAGVRGVSRTIADRIYEHTEFVVLQRDLTQPPLQARCSLSFRLKRVDDTLFERFRQMPEPFPRHFEYRAVYGMRHCFAAWVGDEIGALIWPVFQADNERLVTRWRYLLADEARLASIWASPAYRGTGLMDACFARVEAFLAEAGFRYLYEFTWVGNHASRRLYARRGLREVAKVHRFSFRWQPEGRGLYIRQRVPREPLGVVHPGGDLALPEVID